MPEFLRWIPSIVSLFLAGFNAAIFIVVKFNDLKHLEGSVKELTNSLKETNESLRETNKTIGSNAERLSKIEGRCLANHG